MKKQNYRIDRFSTAWKQFITFDTIERNKLTAQKMIEIYKNQYPNEVFKLIKI